MLSPPCRKAFVQRALLMRAAALDARKAVTDAKHKNSIVADPRMSRNSARVRIDAFEHLPVRAGVVFAAATGQWWD